MITKGQKINDRYQIIKTIGEGGMANVYLAYDTILDRNVAVKILRGDLANDDKFVRRFQREALSASSLNHPNIVEVYDVGEDDGQYFIVMEYIEGQHLKKILKKRNHLTISEVIDIMTQIADGMAHAHDAYIIHRDIKPQNIMVLDNGLVKITDFGIAMALNSTQLTQTNSVMGTVHYLPPEQANGKGATIQSDIYSMGILMYELLCGKLPFKGENAVEIALKHLKEEVPSIREEIATIPQSVENVIKKATAKNPKNRYIDAREMYEDLKTIMDDSRIDEPPYIYPYPEKDTDDNKVVKMLDKAKEEKTDAETEEIVAKQITENDLKNDNKTLLVLGAIFAGLIIITTVIVALLPMLSTEKEIKVPDVVGKTVVEAENILKDAGFKIDEEPCTFATDDVPEGKVAKTNPPGETKRKKETVISICTAISKDKILVEDYVGKDYVEVKVMFELNDINVIIESEEVEDIDLYTAGEIMSQDIEAGEYLTKGDTITLVIPNIIVEYPDFTNGEYAKEDVEAFCEEYGVVLTIEEVESATESAGTIIYQSKSPGYTVAKNTTLIIKVAIEPTGNPEESLIE